jgi:glycosyltransferase involved in cell wall biosynthesis
VRGSASIHAILASDGPLRDRLAASGATVEVLELNDAARSVPRGSVHPARLHPLAALATLRYVARLARRLRQLRPDVVHTNSLKSALYGGAAARLAGIPCVWHVRDMIETPYLPTPAVRLVRGAARVLPTVVVANSASTLRAVGVPRGHVVPSPLDPSIRPSARRQDGDAVVRFAIVGRLAEWKGQRLAIEAFASAFPDGGARLRVVGAAMFGEESYAESLPVLASSLGVSDRVEFCGFVDDVAGVLEETDVVVHASILPEPFGQVVIEAMGARCAVVVADAGGPADLVTDGVDGVVYPMGDRDALAEAMRALASDPAMRARLGDAGVIAAASFTPAALAPMLLEAWNEASARARPRTDRTPRHG